MSVPDILPDSRLTHRPELGCFMMDWPMPNGQKIRIEVQPIFCPGCGKSYCVVPRDNTVFVCWMCPPCFEKWGTLAGTYAVPDEEFNRKVSEELLARFGTKDLTEADVVQLADQLGPALEKLERESPYPSHDRRPRGCSK